jgi:hypothetical protein
MYPVPDGPLFPLKQKVAWSIEPAVQGIAIDVDGNIHVAADVPHGTTAIVHANLKSGRRKLSEKIFVYRPEKNPLIGVWQVGTRVVCGNSHEVKPIPDSSLLSLSASWKFHVNQQFWVGKEHNIAGGIFLAGTYELDVNASEVTLAHLAPKTPIELEVLIQGWQQNFDLEANGTSRRSGTGMRLHSFALEKPKHSLLFRLADIALTNDFINSARTLH